MKNNRPTVCDYTKFKWAYVHSEQIELVPRKEYPNHFSKHFVMFANDKYVIIPTDNEGDGG